MTGPPVRNLDVTFLLSSLGLVRGGLETTAARTAEGLAARGHRVTLVSGSAGRRLPDDIAALPARIVRVPFIPSTLPAWSVLARRRPGLPLKAQSLSFVRACRLDPRVRRLLAATDVTITALEVETVLFSGWRARSGRAHVSWFPGVIDPSWAVRDRSTVRLALSQDLAGRARDLLGLEIDDVAFLPGPPASWLEPPYAVRPKARTLLFVGRLEPNKGVRELLTVFEALAPRFPELRLRLAGEGPERAAAERRLATTGFTGRVELLGALGPEEVRRELASADLLVFPSHYESWGLAIVEAMAVGVPVVASDIPGIREVAGRAACLIPVRDASAWVETVGRLIDDPAARRQLSMAGRERAARFTAEGAVEIMEGWLFRACER